MNRMIAMILTVLLTGSIATGTAISRERADEISGKSEVSGETTAPEEKDYEDDVLILFVSDDLSDEDFGKLLEKYSMTLVASGKVINFRTVKLSKSMTRAELEKFADELTKEEGILSAMVSEVMTLDGAIG